MKYLKLFESFEEYRSVHIEVKNKLNELLPATFSTKVRPVDNKISGIPNKLEIAIRKPSPNNFSASVNYNINEVLPCIEQIKELLDGRYKLYGINANYYHGTLSQNNGSEEDLISFVTNNGRVNSGKYIFIFSLVSFESKTLDEDFPLEELFVCCSDEDVRITKKVSKGFLSINLLLNINVSQYDPNFRRFDANFYRQVGDAIHQCIHYYKFKLVYISMQGSTVQNVFNAGMKFRTLEEWEALDKTKLVLSTVSIHFEL